MDAIDGDRIIAIEWRDLGDDRDPAAAVDHDVESRELDDIGTLLGWSLILNAEASVTTDAAGGYEFAGLATPGSFRIGAVVSSGAGISCGECVQCVAGRTNLCIRYATVGLQRNGALGQLCTVPAATLSAAPISPKRRLPSCFERLPHSMRWPLCEVTISWSVISGTKNCRQS